MPTRTAEPLRILHVSSEVTPFAKTGGLGEVVGALPRALAELGLWTAVVAPRYRCIPRGDLEPLGGRVEVRVGRRTSSVEVLRGWLDARVPVYFVDCPEAFDRDGLYGPPSQGDFADNAWRFGLLSEAAFAIARRLRLHPDVIHAHDWQAGLVPLHCAERYDRFFRSVFTIHNLGFLGTFPADTLDELGLPPGLNTPAGIEFWGWISLLKAGAVFADRVTTVSPRYAEETLSPAFGNGMEGVLRNRGSRYSGILNGIDARAFDPATDPRLAAHFSREDLTGRDLCRRALAVELGLVEDGTLLLGSVTRLSPQKGVDLLCDALLPLLAEGRVRLAMLASGDRALEARIQALAAQFPTRVALRLGYDDALAHRIFAGADAVVQPSRFEPCGLTQLYAMRYGALPIVRHTGGLADTVRRDETGFVFDEPTAAALLAVLRHAVATFAAPDRWRALVDAAMAADFSWARSAARYKSLYEEVVDEP